MAERPERDNRRNGRKGRKKVCSFCVDKVEFIDYKAFCVDKVEFIDYKDISRLRRFVSERAKILPRRVIGTCARHQRDLTVAIKRARYLALMPYTSD